MNFRPHFFPVLISLLCGLFLFFLFRYFAPSEARFASAGNRFQTADAAKEEAFAVLVFDEAQDDRLIQELLSRNGMKSFISESSQYVPIDDFGTLKMFRLDSFHSEIEEFDPRDDGYAAKLKSFFVHGDKRFFFSPLEDIEKNRTAGLKKLFESALGDMPFSFAVLGRKRAVFPYFILLALGCVFTLYLAASRRRFFYQLPVLLASGWAGFPAVLIAALLSGLWELLREPFGELSAGRQRRNAFNYAGNGLRGVLERLKPFRVNLFLSLLFLFFLAFFSVAGGLSLIPVAAACACFFLLYFLSLKAEGERARQNRHVPFVPVLLFPVRSRTFSLFPFLLPFAFVALLALFLPRISPVSGENSVFIDSRYFVHPEDYYRHIAFERSFSYRPLNQPAGDGRNPLNRNDYLRYYLGDDGLIAGSADMGGTGASQTGAPAAGELSAREPPFPLEKLMEFLIEYYGESGGTVEAPKLSSSAPVNREEWISVGIILTICLMDLIKSGISSKKKVLLLGDRRMAA